MSGEYNVSKIGIRYYNTLFTRILDEFDNFQYTPDYGPVNESVEKKEDTINKIVDFMIEDTEWDVYMEYDTSWDDEEYTYVTVTITFPGGGSEQFREEEMEEDWDEYFMNESDSRYLEQHFGITTKWMGQELYNRYIKKLRPIIYEEMLNYDE
jgi:hypothetical protein